ncbi:unnamed protein product [Cuscuta epithymum]|uniref:Replication factor A C-terminal domain-containing protein n=1 Tax=Cuscuta epithymum TaxID=186058 RepID=A0AAV0G801_9ASTE|nr:unnamed protein product [Cuscuta epithymum]
MAAELAIIDVKPEVPKWTCRVTVVEKQNIRTGKTSPVKFMPMILMDSTGTKVQATAFQGDIAGIDQRLSLYSTYLISNAYVKPLTDLRYCVDDAYKFVWSFTRRTLIQDVQPEEGVNFRQLAEAGTRPFWEFFTCYLNNEHISVLAAIVSKLPRTFIVTDNGQKLAWDVVLVDEDCTPVPLTMWEEFVTRHGAEVEKRLNEGDRPLVLLNRVAVNLFQGLSLSTRYDSHMELAPVGERALILKKWVNANTAKIDKLLVDKRYEDALADIAHPITQPRTALSDVEAGLNKVPVVWVYGKFSLTDTSGDSFYVGCDYCNRRVYADDGEEFECLFCGQKQGTTVKRYICNATLHDASSCIPVTIFTSDIFRLLEFTGMDPGVDIDLPALDARLQSITLVAGVKRSRTNENGIQKNPYSIVLVSNDQPPLQPALSVATTSSNTPMDATAVPKRKLQFKSVKDIASPDHDSSSRGQLEDTDGPDELLVNLRSRKRKAPAP